MNNAIEVMTTPFLTVWKNASDLHLLREFGLGKKIDGTQSYLVDAKSQIILTDIISFYYLLTA